MRIAAIVLTSLLTVATLSGCSATVVNNQPPASPEPSSTVAVEAARLRSDLTNAKTALVAYETDKGSLPNPSGDTPLVTKLELYGWSQAATTKSIVYRVGDGPSGKVFCVVAKGESGVSYYITTNSEVSRGSTCPVVARW